MLKPLSHYEARKTSYGPADQRQFTDMVRYPFLLNCLQLTSTQKTPSTLKVIPSSSTTKTPSDSQIKKQCPPPEPGGKKEKEKEKRMHETHIQINISLPDQTCTDVLIYSLAISWLRIPNSRNCIYNIN